ncbi:MAG: hypothetical protein ACFFEO_01855 [Candidatus Thorarchaeota archaeon]
MMIKCPSCGIEYSYGRNICHMCEKYCIFFGSIFNLGRTERDWNCNTKKTLASLDNFPHKSKIVRELDDYELILEKTKPYQWNCDPALKISIQDKGMSYYHLYE